MRSRTVLGGAFSTLLLAMLATVLPGPAAAAAATGDCDTVVVDAARVLGGSRAVAQAARAVAGHHATVRVRTYPKVPGGDLDAAVAAQVRRCASWRDGRGHRRADLLVLAVSLADRRTGLYYGSGWKPALDGEQEAIQTGTVNPLLKRKRYADAVRAGLVAVEGLLPARPGQTPLADPSGAGDDVDDGTGAGTADDAGDGIVDGTVPGEALPFGQAPGLPDAGDAMVPFIGLGVVAVVVSIVIGLLRGAQGGRGGGTRRRRAGSWSSMDGVDRGYASGFSSSSSSGFSSGFSSGSGGSDSGSSSSSSSSDGGGSSTSW